MKIRRLSALFVSALFTLPLFAQPLSNTLLWRISGKTGHYTSYLYGTIHLTDDRVFNLGDSLYAAIKRSSGFASELDQGSLFTLLVEEVEDVVDNTKNIKEVLSKKDYELYAPLLAKKLNKPQGSITTLDILNLKKRGIRDPHSKGQMSTFLDMYLYEAARRQKKWTGGIEDAEDQRAYLQGTVDKSDIVDLVEQDRNGSGSAEAQKLMSAYLRQDLAAIDTLFGDTPDRETLLTKRNIKMAARMDSLCGVRSMVFAVGAAHLPGDQGLIRLLRRKGFDVQPVFSSRKIRATDYPLPEMSVVWDTVKDDNGFYRASMPGIARNVSLFHLINMKMYFDLSDMTGYCASAIPSAFNADRIDSVMDLLADQVFEKGSGKSFSRVSINGARGREYTALSESEYKKGLVLYKDGIVYIVYGIAVKADEKNKLNIDHFLKSFEVIGRQRTAGTASAAVIHTDSAFAFKVATPSKAMLNNDVRNIAGHTLQYASVDPADGSYYFFSVSETLPDHMILDDSAFFRKLVKTTTAQLKHVDFDSTWLVDDQLVTEIHGPMKNVDMQMNMRYIARGSRWYMLMDMHSLSAPQTGIDKFFSSFSELDYPALTWHKLASPDSVFTAWTPGPINLLKRDSTYNADDGKKYLSYDGTRAAGYNIVTYRLDRYYWSNSDSEFWAQRIHGRVHSTDTLIAQRPVTNGEVKGWEYISRRRNAHDYQRTRLLVDSDMIYALVIGVPYKELYTANANRFFDEFRFSRTPRPNVYLMSGANTLVTDLLSADSAVSSKAYLSFNQNLTAFSSRDLPMLYHSLLQVSPRIGRKNWAATVNNTITRAILYLKDGDSYKFAVGKYQQIPDSLGFIKNNLLTLMVQFPDLKRFQTMAELLRTSPPNRPFNLNMVSKLREAPSVTAKIFPDLLPLLNDSIQASAIIQLARFLLDKGLLEKDRLLPYRNALSATLSRSNRSTALDALGLLLATGQPVDSTLLQPLAADLSSRLRLYDTLEKTHNANLFPAAWRTQTAFGESKIYDYAAAEDDPLENGGITLLTSRMVNKKRFLLYKYSNGEYSYLACAGPFDPDPAILVSPGTRAAIYFQSGFDNSRLDEQSEALLKRFETH